MEIKAFYLQQKTPVVTFSSLFLMCVFLSQHSTYTRVYFKKINITASNKTLGGRTGEMT